jgi:ERF superfamily
MNMSVYKAINKVQSALARSGIGKDSTNTFDNYKFRGIDAVYNALAPLLAEHGLCFLPRMLARTCEERVSQKGGALFYVTVDAEFDLVCAADGSKHTIRTFGEAMDRGDKATNKAMSAAYKYAAFQTFAIPTEGDNDAEATTHEVRHDGITHERMSELESLAADMLALQEEGRELAAAKIYYGLPNNEEKLALWGMLRGEGGGSTPESRLRSFIKANKPEENA